MSVGGGLLEVTENLSLVPRPLTKKKTRPGYEAKRTFILTK